jgi:maltooligosyltrehalose synthase
VAFARKFDGRAAVAIAPRLVTGLTGFDDGLPLGAVWGETELDLGELATQPFRNVFTGQTVTVRPDGRIRIEELFAAFPVALLANGEEA